MLISIINDVTTEKEPKIWAKSAFLMLPHNTRGILPPTPDRVKVIKHMGEVQKLIQFSPKLYLAWKCLPRIWILAELLEPI